MTTTFDPLSLQKLHMKAGDVWRRRFRQGWQKSEVSPMKVVEIFDRLWVKRGYELVAYVYGDGISSYGVVWAVETGIFPDVDDCGRMNDRLETPKPEDALNFTDVLEGDGGAESYIQASILVRELRDFGCTFEHSDWGWHEIVGDLEGFTIFAEDVVETPRVISGKQTVVEFCTRSYRTGMVYRHVDVYAGGYSFTPKAEVIGQIS